MNRAIIGLIGLSSLSWLPSASAQSAAGDYASFSQFISARNIFNPDRQAFSGPGQDGGPSDVSSPVTQSIQLVGTMSYEKGTFAFFSGEGAVPGQVLQVGGKVGSYKIQYIKMGTVSLESTGQVKQLELNIGNGLRDENGQWVFSKGGELPVSASGPDSVSESNGTMPSPPPAIEQNDVLKRLMEQRAKENQ